MDLAVQIDHPFEDGLNQSLGAKEWKEIIETIEMHDQELADTLAITADPELQNLLKESEKGIKEGGLLPLEEL